MHAQLRSACEDAQERDREGRKQKECTGYTGHADYGTGAGSGGGEGGSAARTRSELVVGMCGAGMHRDVCVPTVLVCMYVVRRYVCMHMLACSRRFWALPPGCGRTRLIATRINIVVVVVVVSTRASDGQASTGTGGFVSKKRDKND